MMPTMKIEANNEVRFSCTNRQKKQKATINKSRISKRCPSFCKAMAKGITGMLKPRNRYMPSSSCAIIFSISS